MSFFLWSLYMDVLEYFPNNIRMCLLKEINSRNYKFLEEIRIRVNRPIILKFNNEIRKLEYIITTEDILRILEYITENSMYSYQKQICEGYITLRGGHRVGISGNVVVENDKVININYIYSLNFRISKEIIGVANEISKYIYENGNVNNTLIISSPGAGKTTILRDLIRILSEYKTTGVVDERGEIAAMYKNIPQNNLGLQVDILNNIPKSIGMKMLIRSMAPEVICADEIGTKEDIEAIKYAVTSGVKGIFTAHGDSIESITHNPILRELINSNLIENIIILNKNDRKNIKYINNIKKNIDFQAKIV